ncbi:hypothetical protein CBS101457_003720 [Exobasidium rhododendri]|nr:hypothetical protein CBS101457_003720 [Exobasidium rhododendri]
MPPGNALEAVPKQVELISPHYSWDTSAFSSPANPSPISWTHDGRVGDSSRHVGEEVEQPEHIAAYFIESLLARVRNVGYSFAAPDSVHKAVKAIRRRKALTPADNVVGKRNVGLNRRTADALGSRGQAPATVDAAAALIDDIRGFGPHARVRAPGYINAAVSIGTAASGGRRITNEAPLQEPFSVFIPPPFRILFLVALGLLCWSANLRGLRRLGLDADGLMSPETKVKVLPHHQVRREQMGAAVVNTNSQRDLFSSSRTLVGSVDTELAVYFRHPGPQETAAFHLGLMCLIWTSVCWIAYRLYAFHSVFFGGDQVGGFAHARGRHAQAMQSIAVFGAFVVTIWPGDVAYRSMRKALGKQLLLVCRPSFKQVILFPQILFADILTSFARVFGDLWLTMCFLWPKSDTPAWWNGKGSVAVPILVSLPYAIRLRQCLSEYNMSQPAPGTNEKPLKPLYNAAKYASAFPVIWLSVMQGDAKNQDETTNSSAFFYLWILSVLLNSFFSFWWDVTHDWGLDMLRWETWTNTSTMVAQGVKSFHKKSFSSIPMTKQQSSSTSNSMTSPTKESGKRSPTLSNGTNSHLRPHHMLGGSLNGGQSQINGGGGGTTNHSRSRSAFLRSPEHVMLFPPIVYQLAVTCDLLLRFAWSLKLSSHLHHIIELESTAFYLEALEIVRRWAWTFLRIEWEACKRKSWEAEGSMESLTLSTLRSDNETLREDVSVNCERLTRLM